VTASRRNGTGPALAHGALWTAIVWILFPAAAFAQGWIGTPSPHAGSVEISGGLPWSAAYDIGARDAEETRNIGAGGDPFVLFATTSRVSAATGAVGRVGVYLSQSVAVEGGLQYLRPSFETRVSDDAEQAADVVASERTTRYVADGSLVVHLTPLSFAGGKGVPFVLGGGGYIREVHDRNELIDTGSEYHAGVGLKLWFGGGPHRFGLRGEFGVSSRKGGFDFETARRTVRTAGASVIYLF
jgi:hypothetical protein